MNNKDIFLKFGTIVRRIWTFGTFEKFGKVEIFPINRKNFPIPQTNPPPPQKNVVSQFFYFVNAEGKVFWQKLLYLQNYAQNQKCSLISLLG